jgi:hypothetical protein
MATEDRPSHHCRLAEPADLSRVFDAIEIEHLPFETDQTYVIYDHAILKLIVTDGQLTAARAFEAECWDAPTDGPDTVLTSFRDEVVAAIDSDRYPSDVSEV